VALTFDDGPFPGPTTRLFRILQNHQIKATFFIVGKVARRFPSLLKMLAEEGHEIANHTWTHPDLTKISPEGLLEELRRTKSLIEKITGQNTNLFRTPGSTEHFLRKRFSVPEGFQLVLWDLHGLDIQGLTSAEISERVQTKVQDGDVILLHNGRETTVKALDFIIEGLKARDFEFVTVSDLIAYEYRQIFTSVDPTVIQG